MTMKPLRKWTGLQAGRELSKQFALNVKGPAVLKHRSVILIVAVSLSLVSPGMAEVSLPKIFSDHMVLQREMKVPVWGWGRDGEKVTVEFNGQSVSALVKEGTWRVELEPMKAGGPWVMTVRGDNTLTVEDVLVGEVWFTCGQSNMMMGLSSATGGMAFYEKHSPISKDRLRVVFEMGPGLQSDTIKEDVAARWHAPAPGYSVVSYYFAQKLYDHFGGKVPVGMVTYVAIVPAEAWVDAGHIAAHPNLKNLPKHPLKVASKGYNGTIAPISPYAIRGVVYYQAEYNGGRYQEFRDLFPALIASWREAWGREDMPFLFVQLPGFLYHTAGKSKELDMDAATLAQQKKAAKYQWVGMRDVQRWIWQNTPNTGLASAVDIGEKYDIHPRNKEPLGGRLLAAARKVAYGEQIIDSGPWPKSYGVKDGTFVIEYDYVGGGLVAKEDKLAGFELAGTDNTYYPAEGRIQGDTVVVTSSNVPKPTRIRYAWAGFPKCTLYNKEGLPALPFTYVIPGTDVYPATADFGFYNPGFEAIDKRNPELPADWNIFKAKDQTEVGGQRNTDYAGKGEASARLLPGAGMWQNNLADGTGHSWNSNPTRPHFLRPGCIVGYSVQLAVENPSADPVKLYMNLAANQSGGAYQFWGGTRYLSTSSEAFVSRSIVHRLTDNFTGGTSDSAGARWINQSKKTTVLLDDFSNVQIIRPLLKVSLAGPIKLSAAHPKEVFTITNDQTQTLLQKLTDAEEPTVIPTLLYGCAGFKPDAHGLMQVLREATDNVGVILLGKDAAMFELSGENANDAKTGVKLMGTDGQPGLAGGKEPEVETFSVCLKANIEPGTYEALVRIVTQAANVGVVSTANGDQPPVNLHYVDIPVSAVVK
jgi:sialate O-acetylesterase